MGKCALGLIGAGAMGSALIDGLISSGFLAPNDVIVYDIATERAASLQERYGCLVAQSVSELLAQCSRLLLAVKPYQILAILGGIGDGLAGHSVVSIAAGVTLTALQEILPEGCVVTRVMPNTPALIGKGVTALSFSQDVPSSERNWLMAAFSRVGTAVMVPETQMDAVTAVSGSGPAYVYLFLEALIDAGVTAGLPRETASTLAIDTVIGAAEMLKETGWHPGQLKAQVMSPGGTTAYGLKELEVKGVRSAVLEAVLAAKQRSEVMGARD